MPSQHEHRRIATISNSVPDAQLYTEPKGQFAVRHFLGDRFSERLVHVHLDSPDVTDAWIAEHLPDLIHIETLSILSPNVTDKGLGEISRLPNLKVLSLVNTEVSEAAINALRKSKPTSRIDLGETFPDGATTWFPGLER